MVHHTFFIKSHSYLNVVKKARTIIILVLVFTIASSCKGENTNTLSHTDHKTNILKEEQAILNTLNNETKAAFRRDYKAWQDYWIQDSSITKVYLDFTTKKFSESVGWEEISRFVKTFMDEHPEPEPIPKLLDKINVRLYGSGAWVTFEQQDSLRGLKRETRLMEKVDGHWKIAGMQTTIYGLPISNE